MKDSLVPKKFFRQEDIAACCKVNLAMLQKNMYMNKTVAKKTGENFESREKLQKNKAQEIGNRNKDRAVTENNLGSFANNVFVVRQRVF